ncbi:hypothetical protein QWY31_16325 [Cytophagales bacterium LB-30]|uniref:LamG domain-containing protein n=1 Tax=Shiella aurantiaca TaxID=3058365 RepID=A0ABT8F9M5_9BACT|nr:hypothetical protein [Shiella aurantiaca]MDN4167078.1 hypothetical protein [Shiella aurantiaca]
MKKIVSMAAFLLAAGLGHTQNLIDLSPWIVGSGNTGHFIQNGNTPENVREWGDGPYGRAILWRAIPDGSNSADGGFVTEGYSVDHNKMYRLSIWLKKTGSQVGNSYLGLYSGGGEPYITTLAGTESSNPYHFYNDLPELDKWYLVVAFVHGSSDASSVHLGGVYDGTTGEKVANTFDFKFQAGINNLRLRSYLYYVTDSQAQQFFYGPRIEEVNGNETPLEALLGLGIKEGIANNAIYPTKVGINTTSASMGNFELAVNGTIRAKEVKVESDWADFVFEPSYKLRPLSEVEVFIESKGHLPEIPSAAEVANNGVDLGAMDAKLLMKIEELTLYILEQEKRIKALEAKLASETKKETVKE